MRLQQILYIIAIVVSFTMCTERHDRDVHTLLIDMNSTTFEPLIVRQATGECAIVDTMTADNNGVYIIDISSLQTGFYTLQATDSVRIMDIVLCEAFPIEICARRGYENEATTNSTANRIYWTLQQMHNDFAVQCDTIVARYNVSTQSQMRDTARTLIIDKLREIRRSNDSLLSASDNMLVSIPILLSSYNGQKMYSVKNDFDLLEKYANKISQRYPTNELAIDFKQKVDSLIKPVLFSRRYKRGNQLPNITLTTADNSIIELPQEEKRPYAIFYTNDTTAQTKSLWNELISTCPYNSKIYAEIPEKIQHTTKKTNITIGTLQNIDKETITKLQPIIIVVNPNGEIKTVVFNARKRDLNNVYQNLSIFVPTNNQNKKQ